MRPSRDAVAEFAVTCADVNERDYQAARDAARSGLLPVQEGLRLPSRLSIASSPSSRRLQVPGEGVEPSRPSWGQLILSCF